VREYEFTYIVQPDAPDERIEEIHEKVASVITGGQGQILLRDEWGRRRLAYEIEKFQKGNYFQLSLLGDGKFIPELERVLGIDADVLRYMAICVDRDVRDIAGREEWAKREAAERAQRRAERERQEAERLEQEKLAAEQAAATAAAAAAAAEAAEGESEEEPLEAVAEEEPLEAVAEEEPLEAVAEEEEDGATGDEGAAEAPDAEREG
jgi:small subunit ribosomal protein S6